MTRARWARLLLPLAFLAPAVLGAVGGCSPKKMLVPNVPPTTVLFIRGPVSTVNHVVHLYWYGSDPDGFVTGYEWRILNSAATDSAVGRPMKADSQWVFTTQTDEVFSVLTPTGLSNPVFEVRAVDNAGLRDPNPPHQPLSFSNTAPQVTLTNKFQYSAAGYSDSTFASATLSWTAVDPDGNATLVKGRIWLDGNEANADTVSGTSYTIPTARFIQGGSLLSGPRTAYIQGIDDGGRAGPVDSTKWFVRGPGTDGRLKNRLLIIDDTPSGSGFILKQRAAFEGAANGAGGAGVPLARTDYAIMSLRSGPAGGTAFRPFRSDLDVIQTFGLFDAVVWYRGFSAPFDPILGTREAGIGAYLDAGGNLLLEGADLIQAPNTAGALSFQFLLTYARVDYLYQQFNVNIQDSTATWQMDPGGLLSSFETSPADSATLKTGGATALGFRAFAVTDPTQVALWAPPGQLTNTNFPPTNRDPRKLAVSVIVPQAAGGKLMLLSFPIILVDPSFSNGTATKFLKSAYQKLGIRSASASSTLRNRLSLYSNRAPSRRLGARILAAQRPSIVRRAR